MGRVKMRERKRRKTFINQIFLVQLWISTPFLGLEISRSREDEEGRGYLECIHVYPQPSFGNLIQPCTQLQTLNHLNSHKQGFGKH